MRASLVLVCVFFASPLFAQIQSIGFNFVGGNADFVLDVPPLAPNEVAGFVPQANWNNGAVWSTLKAIGNAGLPDEIGTVENLVNSFGDATTADIRWNAENTYNTNTNGLKPSQNGDESLMDGYIDNSQTQPMAEIIVSEIPFDAYDVIVYVGSDANNRSGAVRVNDDTSTDRWYITYSSADVFNGPSDYIEATALQEGRAEISNFVLYEGLQGDELKINNVRGNFNSGIHGVQLIQRLAPFTLRVDTLSGLASIVGGDAVAVGMNGYEISSTLGTLTPASHQSLGSQNLDTIDAQFDTDGIAGSSLGESWEIVNASPESIIEGFLLGSTTVSKEVEIPIGRVVDHTLIDPTMEDLTFSYSLTNGQSFDGLIEFFEGMAIESPFDCNGDSVVNEQDISCATSDTIVEVLNEANILAGDFDLNGSVDFPDFLVLSSTFGQAVDSYAQGDTNLDGVVNFSDFLNLSSNFGSSSASLASVPEPSSCWLLLAAMVFSARFSRRPIRRAANLVSSPFAN